MDIERVEKILNTIISVWDTISLALWPAFVVIAIGMVLHEFANLNMFFAVLYAIAGAGYIMRKIAIRRPYIRF